MVELKNKNAIVTGAAVGLGGQYAEALAREGVNVAVCDEREEVFDRVKTLERFGVKSVAWQGDVSDPAFVRKVVDGTNEAFGGIDILVNNAGVFGVSTADDDLDKSLADYDRIVGTNFKGEFLFGRAVIPIMIEANKGGEIINIATDHMVTCGTPYFVCPKLETCPWGDSPRPTGGGDAMDLYDVSKWALNGLLYGWAKSLKPHGIRVNALCMGATDSYMLRSFNNFDPSEEEVASWMKAEDNAQVMIDILKEGPTGRNAQNINFCMGRPVKTEPAHDHIYVLPEHVAIGDPS
ncbi:MAG: NAD(P)-dependent dehydrogenase (short-subunit alcohol dehydrogenase family) [Candidatus Azotimanducaceae bacterium]|jgi:NAD(P)-dependent dehydrogenase (short-subunit alcohol dehydrogenase family)